MDEPALGELIAKAARSILAVDRGEYCECAEPDSLGMVCARCDRRICSEEVRMIVKIVGCHQHEYGDMGVVSQALDDYAEAVRDEPSAESIAETLSLRLKAVGALALVGCPDPVEEFEAFLSRLQSWRKRVEEETVKAEAKWGCSLRSGSKIEATLVGGATVRIMVG